MLEVINLFLLKKIIRFSVKEVTLIVDLPYHEMKISATVGPKKKGRLFERFRASLDLHHKRLKRLIDQLKSSKRKEDIIEDAIRLWIAYILTIFLSPKSN